MLRTHSPATQVLILTAYHEDREVRPLMRLGIAGYVLKDEALDCLVQAVLTVARGGTWFSRAVTERFAQWSRGPDLPPWEERLTLREREVLWLVIEGRTNQEIGQVLGLRDKTVAKHLSEVFTKMGVTTRVEAAVRAVRAQFR
ncbi:MAG: response regulator transcription factor [Chloroflexaceae bacterium]|nr:response regulator transcription factor [Chloroflexaceae bacterium]